MSVKMKKFVVAIFTFCIILTFFNFAYATAPLQQSEELENKTQSELVEIKSKSEAEIDELEALYGSRTYGLTAYILKKVQIYSIPLCFLGIAVGSIYQYVIGIRRMDVRDRGFALIIGFVTVLVICQVLPLVFAIVVQGWRG